MATIKKRGYANQRHQQQEIESLARTVSDWIFKNRRSFTIAMSIMAAVLVLVGGFTVKRSMDEQKAGMLLAAAYEAYNPSAGSAPDNAKALELFRDASDKYPSSLSGTLARYYKANVLMNMGRAEEALKDYEYLTRHTDDPFLRSLVYQRMGYLHSSNGRPADAIKAFEQADALNGPGMATMELARLYASADKTAEAERKYKAIADKLPGTAWAVEAQSKLPNRGALPAAGDTQPVEPKADAQNK